MLQGNKPPWTLKAKALYSKPDSARAKRYFGVPKVQTPSFFPILSLLPQRALVYVKATYPELFVQTFLDIFSAMWEEDQDVSKPDLLSAALSKRFEEVQVREIVDKATAPENKKVLNANTAEALQQGAFGCPWFWVQNSKGEEEPFFGSDRYVHLFPVGISSSLSMVPGGKFGCMRTMKRELGRASLILVGSISCGSTWSCHGRMLSCSRLRKRRSELDIRPASSGKRGGHLGVGRRQGTEYPVLVYCLLQIDTSHGRCRVARA